MGQSFNAPYEAIGEELLSQLVDTFYERVKRHPSLLPDFSGRLNGNGKKAEAIFNAIFRRSAALYRRTRTPDAEGAAPAVSDHTGTGGRMAFVYERGNGSCRFKGRNQGISF